MTISYFILIYGLKIASLQIDRTKISSHILRIASPKKYLLHLY